MATELRMPQMGYDMEEGTVVRWLKEEGSEVGRNEAVAEIETDKAVVEFESEAEGILIKIIASEGSVVQVGQPIAVVGKEGEQPSQTSALEPSDRTEETEPERLDIVQPESRSAQISTPEKRLLATPVARRIADELGINLQAVTGTGPGGRITKRDVETFNLSAPGADDTEVVTDSQVSPPSPEATTPTTDVAPDPRMTTSDPPTISSGMKEPLSRMRQQIARVTVKSKSEKPHFYVSAEVDMTKAMTLRSQINGQLTDEGVRISVNDLIIKACVDSLKKYPKFNAYYEADGIQYNNTVNIAVAIAEEEGLIVPAILDCGKKSLRQLSQMVKDLALRASNGTLSTQEYTGGTFAISNLGMFDVTSFVAIIHPPQSAVLAVGTVSEKPVVLDGELSIAQIMTATLSADHRIVDGVEGAQFLIEVKNLLESPMGLVI